MNADWKDTLGYAEAYIPPSSTGPHPQMTSHETICLLNAGDVDAQV
jgi:hypothetical protein